MADTVGIARNKIIKHFSGPYVLEEENHGLTPSLISTKSVIMDGLKKGKNILIKILFFLVLNKVLNPFWYGDGSFKPW